MLRNVVRGIRQDVLAIADAVIGRWVNSVGVANDGF